MKKGSAGFKRSLRKQCSANKTTTTETTLKYQSGVWGFWVVCAYMKPHFMCLYVCYVTSVFACVGFWLYPDYEDPFDEGEAKA